MFDRVNIGGVVKKLLVIVKMVYHKTPTCFHFIFWPLKFVDRLINKLRYDLWILRGKDIDSKQEIAIIYAGIAGRIKNRNYLIQLAFGNSFREHYLEKTWLWKVSKVIKEKGRDCSLMVMEIHKVFRIFHEDKSCFYVPSWIVGEIDISFKHPSEIKGSLSKNESLSNDLRKIRKHKMDFEVTNKSSHFHNFYHTMYLPYISESHDNRAVLNSYDFMKKKFRKSDLLFIKNEEGYIAGVIIRYSRKGPRLWSAGVKDANKNYIHNGAVAATYYYSVNYLKEKGFRKLNLGLSRAFLKDGVLGYKKKWGLEIVGADKYGFIIKPLKDSIGVRRFFLNNPFVFLDKKKRFHGAIFVDTEQSFTEKDFERIYKNYYLPGISHLFIYFDGEVDSKILRAVPSELRDTIKIYSAEKFFDGTGKFAGGWETS